MAIIRPRPQKAMRTAEGWISREQLNTGRHIRMTKNIFRKGYARRNLGPGTVKRCRQVTGGRADRRRCGRRQWCCGVSLCKVAQAA